MSFYTSLSGLKSAQTDLDVVAHNIANAETNGFKRSRVDFADVVVNSASGTTSVGNGIGVRVASVDQDFSIGPVDQTGAALDVSISGDGFFTTVSPTSSQTFYSRDGAFVMDPAGFLNDGDHNRLQMLAAGAAAGSPPVTAQVPQLNASASPLAGVTIAANGDISGTYLDGTSTVVGSVALAAFAAPTGLKAAGSSNWQATGRSGSPSYGTPGGGVYGALLTGSLERSNVDIAAELVNLITAQRYFQANAKAINTSSEISQTIINLRT